MQELIIKDTQIVNDKLTSKIIPPDGLKKYLNSTSFFAIYDSEIRADKSILNIPPLSAVLPLAWLTGSNIIVDKLDRTFKESVEVIRDELKKTFLNSPFTTKLKADELVENKIIVESAEHTALTFSGGVDSTYSLITNLNLKPKLLMVWGLDDYAYPENPAQWQKIISTYSELAEKKKLKLHVIMTNISQVLNIRRIEHDFNKQLYDGRLRERLYHSFLQIPITAPLSVGRFDHLLVAAGGSPSSAHHHGGIPSITQPGVDEKIIWADLRVKHDGYISRTKKIMGPIRKYLEKEKLTLKVCIRRLESEELNDNSCEKCLRTIAALVMAGVNPNSCGFKVDDSTFEKMRYLLEKKKMHLPGSWSRMQKTIPDNLESNLSGANEFFTWFRNFDLKARKPDKRLKEYRAFYNKLPYMFSKRLDQIYNKVGINARPH